VAADLIALRETPEDYDKHSILTADIDPDPDLPGGKVFDKAVIWKIADLTRMSFDEQDRRSNRVAMWQCGHVAPPPSGVIPAIPAGGGWATLL